MVPFTSNRAFLLSSLQIKNILNIDTVTGTFSSRAPSVVLGGVNNNLNANNAFILGSNIDATQDNFTYVNSLSSTNDIYGSGLLKIGTGFDINIVGAYGLFTSPIGINAGFTIHRGDNSSYASLDFLENGLTSTGWSIQMQPGNSDLQFVDRVNSTNAFTIQAGGNVGIGTDSPTTKLDVDGVITATGGNSNNWNDAYSNLVGNSASYLSGYDTTLFAKASSQAYELVLQEGATVTPTSAYPTNFSGLQLWLRADVGVTYDGSNNVSDWADQSGNGNDAYLTPGSTEPIYVSNYINGLPAIDFASVYDSSLRVDISQASKTVFAVLSTNNTLSQYQAAVECAGGGIYTAIAGNRFGSYFGTEVGYTALSINTAYILEVLSENGTLNYGYVNGVEYIVGGSSLQYRSHLTVGNADFLGQNSQSRIAEVICFNRKLTNYERTQVELYLSQKYNISVLPPSPTTTVGISSIKTTIGSNTVQFGVYSAILGGNNNSLSANNAFILGSNINATNSNFTYVNNLSVSDNVYADGNIGVGTSTPITKLQIVGDASSAPLLKVGTLEFQPYSINNAWIGDNAYYDGSNFIRREDGYAGLFYFQGPEGQFRFADNDDAGTSFAPEIQVKFGMGGKFGVGSNIDYNTNSYTGANFFINDSGDVGIGLIDQGSRLHVKGYSNNVNTPIQIIESTGSQAPYTFRVNSIDQAYVKGDDAGNLAFGAQNFIAYEAGGFGAGYERMRITSDGNIGIGLTNPIRRYHQSGGKFLVESNQGGYGQFQIVNPDPSEVTCVFVAEGVPQGDGTINSSSNSYIWAFGLGSYENTPDKFIIGNNNLGNAAFTISADGSVGIGTTSPTTKLDVDGVITATGGNSDEWNTAYDSSVFNIIGATNQLNVVSGQSPGQTYVTLSFAPSVVFPGDVNIGGSLYVAGSAAYINVKDLVVDDSLIYLANGNVANLFDIGFVAHFTQAPLGYQHTGLVRRWGQGRPGVWTLFSGLTTEPLTGNNLDWADRNITLDALSANIYSSDGNSFGWSSNYSTTNTNSARWASVYNTFNSNSGKYENTYSYVLAQSAKWDSAYNSYNSISARYTTIDYLSTNLVRISALAVTDYLSAGNIVSEGTVGVISDNINELGYGNNTLTLAFTGGTFVKSNLTSLSVLSTVSWGDSRLWFSAYTTTNSNSASWTSVYNTFNSNSAKYDSSWTTTNSNSARWDSVYNTFNSNSANYAIQNQSATFSTLTITNSATIVNNLSVGGTIFSSNTAYAIQYYSASIGNGVNSSFNISHNFNTRDVVVSVRDTTTNEVVFPLIVIVDTNTVNIAFTFVPTSNAYTVVVIGASTSNRIAAYGNATTAIEKYTFYSSNFNLVTAGYYAIDTRTNIVRATLPSSPNPGDTMLFIDPFKTWSTNYFVLNNNGNNIESLNEPLTADILADFKVTFVGSTVGWRIY